MRTKHVFEHLLLGALMLTTGKVVAQSTTPGNVANLATDFLGWDNTFPANNFPLMVRHDLNQPIEWWTNAVRRMQLTQTLVNQNFGWYTTNSLDFSGHLGIGNPTPNPPLTYLHIYNGFTGVTPGYRPWMRVGAFFTLDSDGLYVGMRPMNGQSQSVLCWSDDLTGNQGQGPDPMCFVFTRQPDNTNTASTLAGLELARLLPAANGNEGFLGVGNYLSAGLQPNERVDVLDGRVRIRALPEPDGEVTASYKVMVVDDSPAPSAERGVVKWIDPADLPPTGGGGGADCDWDISSSGNKITTAWKTVNSNGNCPEADWNVGVGTNSPSAKLHVTRELNSGGVNHGGRFELSGTASGKRSLWGNVLGSGTQHTAVRGETVNGTTRNFGLHGIATLEANVTGSENYAGFGEAIVNEAAVCDRNAGMRGEGRVTGNAVDNYGVFGFAGAYGSVSNNQAVRALGTAAANSSVGLNYGLNALANALNNSAVDTNYAVYASASAGAGNVGANYGVYAQATGNNTVARNYGLRALSSGPAGVNYGVFARATGGGTDWAGYFVGNVHATGNVTWSSDEMLKSEIEPLENAMEIIGSLRPKRYNFRTEEFAQLNLPQGSRMGLIAQDVQQVLPVLVQPVSHPEEYDAETGVTHPGVDYLSLNYA